MRINILWKYLGQNVDKVVILFFHSLEINEKNSKFTTNY